MDIDTKQLIEELESWGAEPKQVIDETFMGDDTFYKECLKKFAEDKHLSELREALVPEKMDLAIRVVHTMKGNADYLGLFPILDSSVTVLMDLRNNQLDQAITDMAELEKSIAIFKKLIQPFIV